MSDDRKTKGGEGRERRRAKYRAIEAGYGSEVWIEVGDDSTLRVRLEAYSSMERGRRRGGQKEKMERKKEQGEKEGERGEEEEEEVTQEKHPKHQG